MLRLRPFKPADGAYLVKWFDNEEMFTKWSAGQFSYPLTRQQVDDYCRKWEEDSNGWPMAVTDETGRVVGHLLITRKTVSFLDLLWWIHPSEERDTEKKCFLWLCGMRLRF